MYSQNEINEAIAAPMCAGRFGIKDHRMNMHLRKETRNGIAGVAYYGDEQLTVEKCFNTWPSRPTKRNKYVMYNCSKYNAIWH